MINDAHLTTHDCVTSAYTCLQLTNLCPSVYTHRFPDLLPLSSASDPELDFYLNVAHVQLHRRSRALTRLAKMADAMAEEQNPQGSVFKCVCMSVCALTRLARMADAMAEEQNPQGHVF